ncbi:hypothetical protein BJF79_19175 [Actinomadura sp. CNU-125]|nr:hypothetical protein BJF79_19175 [Actinomadura sp. CNU-125]
MTVPVGASRSTSEKLQASTGARNSPLRNASTDMAARPGARTSGAYPTARAASSHGSLRRGSPAQRRAP